MSAYQSIVQRQAHVPVRQLCQVLCVAPSAYYAWQRCQQSMSRRGNCYDYAHAESFWRRPKTELLDGGNFHNVSEARLEISHYLAYYNAKHQHSAFRLVPK